MRVYKHGIFHMLWVKLLWW